jgi:CDP-diacylglycerol--glycerol-3-phosphate 3-phosphatidyltransferase
LFRSKALTDYFFQIHAAVSAISFVVEPNLDTKQGFSLEWKQHPAVVPNPLEDEATFIRIASERLAPLLKPDRQQARELTIVSDDSPVTYVYPVSQFSQILNPDTSTELPALSRVLSLLGTDRFDWTLTAGYFNIHPRFTDKLLKTFPNSGQIITASPYANGFYKSSGVSGLLPGVYSHLASKFLERIQSASKHKTIQMREWRRGTVNVGDGWSYHAKGIWASLPRDASNQQSRTPCLTVIGSSNYTRRAYTHDLESNAVLFTQDGDLQRQLQEEITNLQKHTSIITAKDYDQEDRRPDWRQKLFAWVMADKL